MWLSNTQYSCSHIKDILDALDFIYLPFTFLQLYILHLGFNCYRTKSLWQCFFLVSIKDNLPFPVSIWWEKVSSSSKIIWLYLPHYITTAIFRIHIYSISDTEPFKAFYVTVCCGMMPMWLPPLYYILPVIQRFCHHLAQNDLLKIVICIHNS